MANILYINNFDLVCFIVYEDSEIYVLCFGTEYSKFVAIF